MIRPLIPLLALLAAAPALARMIPQEVRLTAPTAPETQANAIWSLRAALNVAALQCQKSAFLMTVRNYNDFLRQHSDELAGSMRTMTGHFRRTAGAAQAPRRFDAYTTRTYQSFASFDAQRAFCDSAADAARAALFVRKGRLGPHALTALPALRESLARFDPTEPLATVDRTWVSVPQIPAICTDRRGRLRAC
jgi:hypothetical protein